MLVLSRKQGEKIVIGPNITLVVVGVQGDRVRLGIDAPPEVPILREELRREIRPDFVGTHVRLPFESPFIAEFA